MFRLRSWFLLVSLGAPFCGCRTDPLPAAEAQPYDYCRFEDFGEPCAVAPTVCESFMCTVPCVDTADCPPSETGEVACEPLRDGRRCALRCEEDSDCPEASRCQSEDRVNGDVVHLCKGG